VSERLIFKFVFAAVLGAIAAVACFISFAFPKQRVKVMVVSFVFAVIGIMIGNQDMTKHFPDPYHEMASWCFGGGFAALFFSLFLFRLIQTER
jgi:hypothetical protein